MPWTGSSRSRSAGASGGGGRPAGGGAAAVRVSREVAGTRGGDVPILTRHGRVDAGPPDGDRAALAEAPDGDEAGLSFEQRDSDAVDWKQPSSFGWRRWWRRPVVEEVRSEEHTSELQS